MRKLIRRFDPGGTIPVITGESAKIGTVQACPAGVNGQCAGQVADLQQNSGTTPSRANSWDQLSQAISRGHTSVDLTALIDAINNQDETTMASYRGAVLTASREGGGGDKHIAKNAGYDEDHTVMVTGLVRGSDGNLRPLLYSGYQNGKGQSVYANQVLLGNGTFGASPDDLNGKGRYMIQRGYFIKGANKDYKQLGYKYEEEVRKAQEKKAKAQADFDLNKARVDLDIERVKLKRYQEENQPKLDYLDLTEAIVTKPQHEYYNQKVWDDHFKPYNYHK